MIPIKPCSISVSALRFSSISDIFQQVLGISDEFFDDAMMRHQNAVVQARTKAQNCAKVMKIDRSHPNGLTTNLLKLFEPCPPLEYKPPTKKRKCQPYTATRDASNLLAHEAAFSLGQTQDIHSIPALEAMD